MIKIPKPKLRVTLLGILALVAAISLHLQTKAGDNNKVIIHKQTTFYTPGQKDNCKWVIHVSQKVTTDQGSNSPIQIGIPEVIKDGYIAGILDRRVVGRASRSRRREKRSREAESRI